MTSPELVKHLEDATSQKCVDRISRLPDELLSYVLSLLPSTCAVRTSILSTRWRYLFTLLTCISIDDAPSFGRYSETNRTVEATRRFKEFVDRLLHQISPLKKFSLGCEVLYDNPDFSRWVSIAVQKGVQELHYKLFGRIYCFPDGLFMCETLVSLKITCCVFQNVQIPRSACLPKLKILHLQNIKFDDFKSMERLFSSCELLEELTLKCECQADGHAIHRTGTLKLLTMEQCWFPFGTLKIEAPYLAYLTCIKNIGIKIVPSWKYPCSLVKAELAFDYAAYHDRTYYDDSAEYDREVLKAAASKVTKLCFNKDSFQVLLTLRVDEQMPDFHSLSRLQLDYIPYNSWKYVTSLLDESPQLDTVIFRLGFPSPGRYGPYCCSCNSVSPSDVHLFPFSCHAQVIEVRNFCGHKTSLSLMGHLLKNASVLKRLIIFTTCEIDVEEESEIRNNVLMLPRASIDCCVEINKGPTDEEADWSGDSTIFELWHK